MIEEMNKIIDMAIQDHIINERAFGAVIETTNWQPELPDYMKEHPKLLFQFVGDTLKECTLEELFISVNHPDNTTSEHHYNLYLNDKIYGILTIQNQPIILRPDYYTPVEWDDTYIKEAKEHSTNIFKQNPANEKFFK